MPRDGEAALAAAAGFQRPHRKCGSPCLPNLSSGAPRSMTSMASHGTVGRIDDRRAMAEPSARRPCSVIVGFVVAAMSHMRTASPMFNAPVAAG
jgi:hypothetical protein